jgi:glutathione S-transferase
MLTLYSYPELFGVADNNPFGLKVYAFLRLCGAEFQHCHILDAHYAPHGQLPYLLVGARPIGDSDVIIDHVARKLGVESQWESWPRGESLDVLARRTLDDLYWPMSYSRWRDDRFWPSFRTALLTQHPDISPDDLEKAREYNRIRYHYQGIGRYEPDRVFARGIEDLRSLADMLGEQQFWHGEKPGRTDAAIYGFIANILFYEIETPLKQYVQLRPNLVRHCQAMHERVS